VQTGDSAVREMPAVDDGSDAAAGQPAA